MKGWRRRAFWTTPTRGPGRLNTALAPISRTSWGRKTRHWPTARKRLTRRTPGCTRGLEGREHCLGCPVSGTPCGQFTGSVARSGAAISPASQRNGSTTPKAESFQWCRRGLPLWRWRWRRACRMSWRNCSRRTLRCWSRWKIWLAPMRSSKVSSKRFCLRDRTARF